jgi:hypothetical protein
MSSFLQNYQRQPKIFIDLPSKGVFYDDTVLENGQHMQIPVFGMNAMDEIMFKTPDALFSGDATVQVIKSCIPTILDPWKLVGFDIDYVLIAIRIATYSDDLNITSRCVKCQHENESVLSLTKLIQSFDNYQTENNFEIQDLTFRLKPLTYKQMTDFAIENYQYERTLLQVAKNESLTDDQKNAESKKIYSQSNDLNLRVSVSYIKSVESKEESETNIENITNFIVNNDATFYNTLKENIRKLSMQWELPMVDISCNGNECDHSYKTKVDLDYSNFFGLKFLHSRNLIS